LLLLLVVVVVLLLLLLHSPKHRQGHAVPNTPAPHQQQHTPAANKAHMPPPLSSQHSTGHRHCPAASRL
jgi:hypothetical protein